MSSQIHKRCRIPQSDRQRATRVDPMVVLREVVARVSLATPLREVVTAVAIDVIHKKGADRSLRTRLRPGGAHDNSMAYMA